MRLIYLAVSLVLSIGTGAARTQDLPMGVLAPRLMEQSLGNQQLNPLVRGIDDQALQREWLQELTRRLEQAHIYRQPDPASFAIQLATQDLARRALLKGSRFSPDVESELRNLSNDDLAELLPREMLQAMSRNGQFPNPGILITLPDTPTPGPAPILSSPGGGNVTLPGTPVEKCPPVLQASSLPGHLRCGYWPDGFPDVMVVWSGSKKICTATWIGADIAITAAHCTPPPSNGWIKSPVTPPCYRASLSSGQFRLGPARADPTHVVTDACVHPEYVNGGGSLYDIALLRVKRDAPPPRRFATPIAFVAGDVSIAGFGGDVIRKVETGDRLDIGRQKVETPDDTMMVWTATKKLSFACSGDSGGPVFAGTPRGYQNEDHLLIAILVEVSRCIESSGEETAAILRFAKVDMAWLEVSIAAFRQAPPSPAR